jgi:outer membrane protein TolC
MPSSSMSQEIRSPLDEYIEQALKQNLTLLQKNNLYARSLISLKEAKSLFLPEASFQSSYQTGKGGRSINFPLGDIINPIYRDLNRLNSNFSFKDIQNADVFFLPNNFFESKIHTTIPIINSDLTYNKRIQTQQIILQNLDVEIFKRELIESIKTAYYSYFSANEVLNIYKSALQRAQVNKRINEKLLQNGKGVKAYVLRADGEVEQNQALITDAAKQVENARLYFNFLLNRSADESITIPTDLTITLINADKLLSSQPNADKREEIQSLNEGVNLNKNYLKLNQKQWLPKLNGFLDIGTQNTDFKFNSRSTYYFTGVQLDIPIFKGGRNTYKVRKSEIDLQNAELNRDLVLQQLTLSAQTAKNSYVSISQKSRSLNKQLEAASSYQKLIERGFKEGMNSFIEDVDARNQLTQAQLAVKINEYQLLIAAANFEREIAAGNTKF